LRKRWSPLRALRTSETSARALPVVAVLLVATAGSLSATWLADQAVRSLAHQSLESTARGISLAAEQVLREESGRTVQFERLFSDRVVAYALIFDGGGTVLFHTNPDLRGTAVEDREAFDRAAAGAPASRRTLLGTGRPVLLHDRLLQRPDGQPVLLRLALHTVEVDRMVARTDRLWWSVGTVLALLWGAGLLVLAQAARAAALRRAGERNEALALIGQMTATLAHEIRNAIGGVKGYAQLAAERTDTGDPRARQLAAVLGGVTRIERLVGDLLAYSREERFTIAEIDPAPLLKAAAASVNDWGGRVELDLEPGLRVMADAEKLERALANGVLNAVQAMGDSGLLRVVLRRRGGQAALRIEDTGAGIGPETLPKLFTPFYTTRASGTGLGLAYAKKVVEGMGGSIGLENRVDGAGAVLTVLLPRGGG
jgi:signal transduction histidine kinase